MQIKSFKNYFNVNCILKFEHNSATLCYISHSIQHNTLRVEARRGVSLHFR